MSDNKIIVIAQAYGLKHWLSTPLSGAKRRLLEYFWGEYKNHMSILRKADDSIRQYASHLDGSISNAKTSFKHRRYVDVFYWLHQIHLDMLGMLKDGSEVKQLQNEHLSQYFGETIDADEDLKFFEDYDGLKAEAGIIGESLKGVSRRFLENLYFTDSYKRKEAVQKGVDAAEKTVKDIKDILNRMGYARAKGKINDWSEEYKKLIKVSQDYERFLQELYNLWIKDIVQVKRQQKIDADKKRKDEIEKHKKDMEARNQSKQQKVEEYPEHKAPPPKEKTDVVTQPKVEDYSESKKPSQEKGFSDAVKDTVSDLNKDVTAPKNDLNTKQVGDIIVDEVNSQTKKKQKEKLDIHNRRELEQLTELYHRLTKDDTDNVQSTSEVLEDSKIPVTEEVIRDSVDDIINDVAKKDNDKTVEDKIETKIENAPKPKAKQKKPGRPKKVKVVKPKDENKPITQTKPTEVKSPKPTEVKPPKPTEVKPEEKKSEPPKRKPGRPKKVKTDEDKPQAPKRKPGRPKKVKTQTELQTEPQKIKKVVNKGQRVIASFKNLDEYKSDAGQAFFNDLKKRYPAGVHAVFGRNDSELDDILQREKEKNPQWGFTLEKFDTLSEEFKEKSEESKEKSEELETGPKSEKPKSEKPKSEKPKSEKPKSENVMLFVYESEDDLNAHKDQFMSELKELKEDLKQKIIPISADKALSEIEKLEKGGKKVDVTEFKPKKQAPLMSEIKISDLFDNDSEKVFVYYSKQATNKEFMKALPANADGTININKLKSLPGINLLTTPSFRLVFGIFIPIETIDAMKPIPLTEKEMDKLRPFIGEILPTKVANSVEKIIIKRNHKMFLNELKKFADKGDYYTMAAIMIKYSEQVEVYDVDLSVKLLKKASELLNE